MSGRAYYNEIDPYCAEWLRNLIKEGVIADGEVDERDIREVEPSDLEGFTQCHFFAGIGGWSMALRLAGWGDGRPVWTGSCPCQPFSAAGKQRGTADERHLWPEWFRLIKACRPPTIFGEQVTSASVLGRANAHMSDVSDRQAVFGVLRELQRETPYGLQGMRAARRARSQAPKSRNQSQIQSVEGCKSGQGSGQCCTTPSEEARTAVLSRPGRHSSEDRGWILRDDRHSIRSLDSSGMELSLFGSDRAGGWIHKGEHESCPLCAECDGEHLGTAEDCGDCGCDYGETSGEIERLVRAALSEAQDQSGWPWFSSVCADLEAARYAVRACDLPAAGAGAAHIRQRLWFVADAYGGNAGAERQQRSGEHGQQQEDGGACAVDNASSARCDQAGSRTEEETRDEARLRLSSDRCGEDWRDLAFWRNSEWLECTDGKARPTFARLLYVAYGLSPEPSPGSTGSEEEEIDEGETPAGSHLCMLRIPDGEEEIREPIRGHDGVQGSEILRPDLHGESYGRCDENTFRKEFEAAVGEDGEEGLRELLEELRAAPCPSHRSEPNEQRSAEFDDIVRLLPSARSLAELCGDTNTAKAVQALLEASNEEGALLEAQHAPEEVWRSVIESSEDRIRVDTAEGRWMIGCVSPLAVGVPARTSKLRAYGNAIDLRPAAAFIEAAGGLI